LHSYWIIARLDHYESQVIDGTTFYYKEWNKNHLARVSSITDKTLQQVNANLNMKETPSFNVVIYPNSVEMNRGLRLSSDGNTLGAYYGGNIFILSPTQLEEANSSLKNVLLHE